MTTSRLATVLAIAVAALGAGGAIAGCGASDVPGVSAAKEQAQKAVDQAKKQLDQAEQQVKSLPKDQQATAQQAVDNAREGLKQAQKQLDDIG